MFQDFEFDNGDVDIDNDMNDELNQELSFDVKLGVVIVSLDKDLLRVNESFDEELFVESDGDDENVFFVQLVWKYRNEWDNFLLEDDIFFFEL